jgi:hypothetical protein
MTITFINGPNGIATTSSPGSVQVGSGLSVTTGGVLSVAATPVYNLTWTPSAGNFVSNTISLNNSSGYIIQIVLSGNCDQVYFVPVYNTTLYVSYPQNMTSFPQNNYIEYNSNSITTNGLIMGYQLSQASGLFLTGTVTIPSTQGFGTGTNYMHSFTNDSVHSHGYGNGAHTVSSVANNGSTNLTMTGFYLLITSMVGTVTASARVFQM